MLRDLNRTGSEEPKSPPFFRPGHRRKRDIRIPVRLAIELAVGRVFGVQKQTLVQETRGPADAALARQVAMYIAHVACGLTLTDAGQLFGRDRTTVAHACLVVEEKREDPVFDQAIDLLEWAVPVIATRPIPLTNQY
jgi:chromosomal replication initiation ATPase DnaA